MNKDDLNNHDPRPPLSGFMITSQSSSLGRPHEYSVSTHVLKTFCGNSFLRVNLVLHGGIFSKIKVRIIDCSFVHRS